MADAPAIESSEDAPDYDSLEHLWARTACRVSVIAAGACMAGLCTGGASYVVALPLAAMALWLAVRAIGGAAPHSATRAYAKMAIIVSALSLAFSLAFVLAASAWTAMFMGLILIAN